MQLSGDVLVCYDLASFYDFDIGFWNCSSSVKWFWFGFCSFLIALSVFSNVYLNVIHLSPTHSIDLANVRLFHSVIVLTFQSISLTVFHIVCNSIFVYAYKLAYMYMFDWFCLHGEISNQIRYLLQSSVSWVPFDINTQVTMMQIVIKVFILAFVFCTKWKKKHHCRNSSKI
jgi:hypothetical protein